MRRLTRLKLECAMYWTAAVSVVVMYVWALMRAGIRVFPWQ